MPKMTTDLKNPMSGDKKNLSNPLKGSKNGIKRPASHLDKIQNPIKRK